VAAITSAGSGNWDSTTPNTPWPSGTVPVSGDTVTISSGHTITVPVGYTAVCGTSPTDNTGTVALTINGPLIINGTFKWQGPVRQGNATVTVGAGGTVTYDASGAATPASAAYIWEMASNSSQTGQRQDRLQRHQRLPLHVQQPGQRDGCEVRAELNQLVGQRAVRFRHLYRFQLHRLVFDLGDCVEAQHVGWETDSSKLHVR